MDLISPQIYTDELAVFPVDKSSPFDDVFNIISDGNFVLVEDLYSTGLQLLNDLKKKFRNLEKPDFRTSRKDRINFRALSHRILLEVENHQLIIRKSPHIPWFKRFYPNDDYFAISFPDVQALNSSWQWYKNGIEIPGLSHKIHPWYGVYFPTRFEHIKLFNEWLKESVGENNTAYDIGSGSGILSFLLEKQGFKNIFATDINPNAILSLKEEIIKNNYIHIEARQGSFFGNIQEKADLIVFNPPWLPEPRKNAYLDQAVYFSEKLFSEFFEQASKRLQPKGKLVLLFSNLIKLTHPNHPHPIKEELNTHNRFKLDRLLQKEIDKGSQKTKRNTSRRENELIELWILQLNT